MNYDEKFVGGMIINYFKLRGSLIKLRELRGDRSGADMHYVINLYNEANEAREFFNSELVTSALKESLKMGDLEKELNDLKSLNILSFLKN